LPPSILCQSLSISISISTFPFQHFQKLKIHFHLRRKQDRQTSQRQAKEDVEWSKGSNGRKAMRDAKAQDKSAAARAKKQAIAEAEAADNEMLSNMKKSKGKSRKAEKKKKPLTAFQRQMIRAKKEKDAEKLAKQEEMAKGGVIMQEDVLKPNQNKQRGELFEASTLEGALSVLGLAAASVVDKHPEKRQKAAFLAYKERQIPILRAENPGLKRTQIDEKIWKLWQKSSENPMIGHRNTKS
jgi:hypothetical protein